VDEFLLRVFSQQWMLALIVTGILGAVAEFGYRRGMRLHAGPNDPRRNQIAAVQAAVLGLVGLLLGFTFSMAVDRYDSRRGLVLREAHTVRTAWLRSSLLPEEHRQPVRHLLGSYLDLRILSPQAQKDPALVADAIRRSREIHEMLWQHADAAARDAPNDMTAMFIETLNDLIDTDIARVAAGRNRIPSVVWLLLIAVAGVGCWTSNYAAGVDGMRSSLTSVLLPLLITGVILLVFDLTNERRGIIRVSQQPLIDVQRSLP
jgi:hypothetical protein